MTLRKHIAGVRHGQIDGREPKKSVTKIENDAMDEDSLFATPTR